MFVKISDILFGAVQRPVLWWTGTPSYGRKREASRWRKII